MSEKIALAEIIFTHVDKKSGAIITKESFDSWEAANRFLENIASETSKPGEFAKILFFVAWEDEWIFSGEYNISNLDVIDIKTQVKNTVRRQAGLMSPEEANNQSAYLAYAAEVLPEDREAAKRFLENYLADDYF